MVDGSGDQAPKPHGSNKLPPHPTMTSILPRQMSRADVKIFCSWLQHHLPSNQYHNSPAAVANKASEGIHLVSPQVSCGREGGRERGKGLEEIGSLGEWLVTDTVLKRRLCELVWQPGQQLCWFSVHLPHFAAEASRLRANECRTLRGERKAGKRQGMGEHEPNPCSVADCVVTAKPSAGLQGSSAVGMYFR